MMPTPEELVTLAATTVFDRQLVTNVHRAVLVEAIVSRALPAGWRWCSADYASWDFEHEDGTRLEVKQSAAKQSWESAKPSAIGWDIAPRQGSWDGLVWRPGIRRNAHIYVLAHHPVVDHTADHRDPRQWRFFVVDERALPPTKRMGMATVTLFSETVGFNELSQRVEELRHRVASAHGLTPAINCTPPGEELIPCPRPWGDLTIPQLKNLVESHRRGEERLDLR